MNEHPDWAAQRETEGRMPVNVPFPLRADFIATVKIPRDITGKEAERLAAMVRTLAQSTGETPDHPSVDLYRCLTEIMSPREAARWLYTHTQDGWRSSADADDLLTPLEMLDQDRGDEVDAEIRKLEAERVHARSDTKSHPGHRPVEDSSQPPSAPAPLRASRKRNAAAEEPAPPLNPLERRLIAEGLRAFTDPTLNEVRTPDASAKMKAHDILIEEVVDDVLKAAGRNPALCNRAFKVGVDTAIRAGLARLNANEKEGP